HQSGEKKRNDCRVRAEGQGKNGLFFAFFTALYPHLHPLQHAFVTNRPSTLISDPLLLQAFPTRPAKRVGSNRATGSEYPGRTRKRPDGELSGSSSSN